MSTDYNNTFRASYPIDFDLFDKDSQNVLYIEDNSDQLLTLEIRNASAKDIQLKDLGAAPLSATNYHFALRFRPGTLAKTSLSGARSIQLINNTARSNWEMLQARHDTENWDVIYLRKTSELTIKCKTQTEKEPRQTIVFNQVGADGGQGARGTRVQLICTNMNYQGSTEPINTTREIHMGIINHRGKKNIPLQLGFVGGNTVVNDGKPNAPLTLRLANIAPYHELNPTQSNITFKYDAKDATKTTKLFLSFQTGKENDAWALDTDAIVSKIKIDPLPGWTITPLKQGEKPVWILSPGAGADPSKNQTITLPGMEDPASAAKWHLDIVINNIMSNFPCGQTHLYIYYQNIPGYWDGNMTCIIEKTPIKAEQNLVEIHGKSSGDNIPFQIVASPDSAGPLMGFITEHEDQKKNLLVIGATGNTNNIENNKRPLVIKNVYTDEKARKKKEEEIARFTIGGKVGIGGVTEPTASIDVASNSAIPALQLHNGNSAAITSENQITLAYHDLKEKDTYRHAIKTRHNNTGGAGNAIDFYLWDQSKDKHTTIGSLHTLSLNNGKAGIGGITEPTASVDVGPHKDIPALQLHNGNILNSISENQITFAYHDSGATYRHVIKTRHNADNGDGNAVDFYVWKHGTDNKATIGSLHTLSLNNGKVGIGGITEPKASLEVHGDIKCNKLNIAGAGNDTVELSVNGRIESTGNAGGLWCDASHEAFVGKGTNGRDNFFGLFNKDWALSADTHGNVSIHKKLFLKSFKESQWQWVSFDPSGEIKLGNLSDRRLKQNITTVPDALQVIQALRGVSYEWNEEGLQQKTKDVEENYRAASNTPEDNASLWEREKQRIRQENARTFHGFIAQEVEAVFPGWVKENKDGYKTINMDELAPLMVEALKTQQQQINTLQAQVEMLMNEMKALKNIH